MVDGQRSKCVERARYKWRPRPSRSGYTCAFHDNQCVWQHSTKFYEPIELHFVQKIAVFWPDRKIRTVRNGMDGVKTEKKMQIVSEIV